MKKKIFVTGSSGFIGSHLVEELVFNGYYVKALVPYNIDNSWGWLDNLDLSTKKNINVVMGNINDPFLLIKETKNCDVIFHLAALISIPYSYKSPSDYISTNVVGTLNVLEAAKKNNISHFIQTSTSEVYGSAQFRPINEDHPLNAQSPYAASKIAADQLTSSYYKSFGLPVTIIRPFNTFGPRQSLRAVLPNILFQIANSDEKETIIRLGNIYSRRDFTYVSDTIQGFVKCINNKKILGEVINLGTGHDFSIQDSIQILEKITKKKFKIIIENSRIRPNKSEVNLLISNNSKAKKILNWKPEFRGKKGFGYALEKTLEWFKEKKNIRSYKGLIYNV